MLDFLLRRLGIDRVRKVSAARLSGGERRRCEIARALASSPSFVLLDEPFAGIDPIAVSDIRLLVRLITREGVGVLITDHNVRETLSLIDRAYIMEAGRVFVHGTAGRDRQPSRTAHLSRRGFLSLGQRQRLTNPTGSFRSYMPM